MPFTFFRSDEHGRHREMSEGGSSPYDAEHDHKSPAEEEKHDVYTSDGESVESSGQDGVKKAQATTIVWSRTALVTAYGL